MKRGRGWYLGVRSGPDGVSRGTYWGWRSGQWRSCAREGGFLVVSAVRGPSRHASTACRDTIEQFQGKIETYQSIFASVVRISPNTASTPAHLLSADTPTPLVKLTSLPRIPTSDPYNPLHIPHDPHLQAPQEQLPLREARLRPSRESVVCALDLRGDFVCCKEGHGREVVLLKSAGLRQARDASRQLMGRSM